MKKLALVMMALVAIFAFTACGGSETVASAPTSPAAPAPSAPTVPSTSVDLAPSSSVDPASVPANPKDPAPAAPAPSTPADSTRDPVGPSVSESTTAPVDSTPTPEPAASTPAEPEPTDPYADLEVPFDFVQHFGGVFLTKDGKYYSDSIALPEIHTEKNWGTLEYNNHVELTFLPDSTHIILLGDFPIFTLDGDYSVITAITTDITIVKLEKLGYTCLVDGNVSRRWRFCNLEEGVGHGAGITISGGTPYDEQIKITGEDGIEKSLYERYNFEKGENLVISWFEGTAYKELNYTADFLSFDRSAGVFEKAKGTLTKNGYAEYENLSLDSGYWLLDNTVVYVP